MRRRILDVTSHTTFDYLDATVRGGDWTADSVAVLDVDAPPRAAGPGDGAGEAGDRPDRPTVTVDIEVDPAPDAGLERHVDALSLTPAEARALADALDSAATDAEDGGREQRGRG